MIRRNVPRRRFGGKMRGTSLEAAIALPVKYVMSLVGAAVSIGGFIALVAADSVKAWVRSHPYPIYFALIVAILIIAGTLDYAYNLRKRLARPTGHDAKLYAAALSALPADGAVIGWLKRVDMATAGVADFPADVLAALEKAADEACMRPVGFDDPRLMASFKSLTQAITRFCGAVEHWTIAEQANGAPTGETTAATALRESHEELVRTYDMFIRTAHAGGIDTDG
jgi:hypothetical protein